MSYKHLKISFKVIQCLCLSLLISCGKEIRLSGTEVKAEAFGQKFYMSTTADLLNDYKTIRTINLYDVYPDLDSLEITTENFWALMDYLEGEALNMRSSYAVIVKGDGCNAKIGYCQAHIIDRYVE